MVEHGTYFDSNNHLMIHNYLENKPHFLGIGNYTEEGFAYMERGLASGNDSFKRALAANVKMVFGTDATAGAHGRNAEELIYRVKDGGQQPMDAIVTATSTSAESLRLGDRIGDDCAGHGGRHHRDDGNPLQDITAVRRVTFVMKGGKVFKNEVPRIEPGATQEDELSDHRSRNDVARGDIAALADVSLAANHRVGAIEGRPVDRHLEAERREVDIHAGAADQGRYAQLRSGQDGWLIVTTETTQPSGENTGVRFAAKFDGKEYPQIGRFAPTVTLISYQPVDKRTLKYTVKDTCGKVTSTNTRTVSADGKTMTIEQRSTDASGRPVVNVEMFERQ